ncbi:MAG TPA: alpha/beta hydrolase, partial [Lachnospiraceae bacterium]|nr:alpha/beta hydrolase [Lachnospiraceae bacterium]
VEAWFGHLNRDLKMDIIRPFPIEGKKYPCIVWVCGGAWVQMDIHAHLPNFVELARAGYVIASVEYRDSNSVKFPGQLEDIKSAIRYLRANSDKFQIDSEYIGIMGESAGGHLSAMAAVTGDRKEFDKGFYLEYSSAVQAACPWYLPCAFDKMPKSDKEDIAMSPESWLIGADASKHPELVRKASPIHYINENTPPFLLIHGVEDTLVPYNQSEAMYTALEEKKIPVDLIGIKGANHADIHFFQPEIVNIVQEFFDKNLK